MTAPDRPQSRREWQWKAAGSAGADRADLLYEPGNWGDVLKGTWALAAARRLAARGEAVRCLDPFAGAPIYPLAAAARARLGSLAGHPFACAQEPYAARDELASTALIVRDAVTGCGAGMVLEVFDADPARQRQWTGVPGAERLEATGGEEILAAGRGEAVQLLLVDPYDLVDRHAAILPPALRAAASAVVILYLYNKSPRTGGHGRAYRALRQAIARGTPSNARELVGRLASDAVLPRAYHEVILLAPAAIAGSLEAELRDATGELAARLARAGAFEPG